MGGVKGGRDLLGRIWDQELLQLTRPPDIGNTPGRKDVLFFGGRRGQIQIHAGGQSSAEVLSRKGGS